MALLYLAAPFIVAALLSVPYQCLPNSLGMMTQPFAFDLKNFWLQQCYIGGAISTAVLLGYWLTKTLSRKYKIAYFALFFVTFPITYFVGFILFLPFYVRNMILLLRGEYAPSKKQKQADDEHADQGIVCLPKGSSLWKIPVFSAALIILIAVVVVSMRAINGPQKKIVSSDTPEQAYSSYFGAVPWQIIEDEEGLVYAVGISPKKRLHCGIIQQEDSGAWKLAEDLSGQLDNTTTDMALSPFNPTVVQVYKSTKYKKDIVFVIKALFFSQDISTLGNEPYDSNDSIFYSKTVHEPFRGEIYYYWAITDCEKPGYEIKAW